MRVSTPLALVSAALLAAGGFALEGKWTPRQLGELDQQWLAEQGLQVPTSALWDPVAGGGLLAAVVDIDGCTAVLVSGEGLLLTNHHCVSAMLQQQSTPRADFLSAGFLAPERGAELPGYSSAAMVPARFTDVTADVEKAVPAKVEGLARSRAIAQRQKELVAECERQRGRRCRVAAFDGGLQYVLVESLEYPDVRLVYAPPQALGDFGGEVDNWMWPRHTGDFAFLRIWADRQGQPARPSRENVPLRTERFVRPGLGGVKPGDFVLTAGYPSRSFRSLTAPEMGERAALYFPLRAELYGAWQAILEGASVRDDVARMALADRVQSMSNVAKNARGQIAGLARGNLVEKKWSLETRVLAWAGERPEMREAVAAHQSLAGIVEQRRTTWRRDFLLDSMRGGPLPLYFALTLTRWARERGKPDMERQSDYMERNRERLREALEQSQTGFDLATEKALMVDLFERFAALPEGSRSPAVDRFLGSSRSHASIAGRVEVVLAPTRVLDWPSQRAMFDESYAALRLRRDPLLELALALDDELRAQEQRQEQEEGETSLLRPAWMRAVHAFLGVPVSPDANGTLRVSFGHIQGYSPRDGVSMLPQTTLRGLLAKAGDVPPFALPEGLLTAARRGGAARWQDAALGDVPVAFLADLDTSSGTSGSPVLNGRGELVGLNFDRVWEAVAGDFGYDPELNRNVSVDIRFLLWTLEIMEGPRATGLLRELGVLP
jgi:hypothetical protein